MSEFLSKAFTAHANVKNRLKKAVLGEENIDPDTVRSDDKCEVGKWIYGEGASQYGSNLDFQTFKASHTAFHQAAYDALMLLKKGQKDAAHEMIENGEFQKRSYELGICITKLKATVK